MFTRRNTLKGMIVFVLVIGLVVLEAGAQSDTLPFDVAIGFYGEEDDRLEMGDLEGVALENEFTIEWWFLVETHPYSLPNRRLAEFGIGGNEFIDLMQARRGWEDGIALEMHIEGSRYRSLTEGNLEEIIELGGWHHFALSVKGGEKVRFYIDGEDVTGSVQIPEQFKVSSLTDGRIGRNFHGMMAEIRLWDTYRTQQQIQDRADEAFSGDEDTLVGYWSIARGHESSVEDLAGRNDGELVGQARWRIARPPEAELRNIAPGDTVTLAPIELPDMQETVEYEWYFNNEKIEGAKENSLEISDVTAEDLGVYHVKVEEDARKFYLPLEPDWPMWASNLEDKVVKGGETVTLGPVELYAPADDVTYQWFFEDELIEGATEQSLTLPNIGRAEFGTYHVKVDDNSERTPVESTQAMVNIPAFPGAVGAGLFTRGGRGGDVYHVTSPDDSGPGTLREGLKTADGPRTIVFDIGGTIHLEEKLVIDQSYLTIAGQTAPGDGITIKSNDDVIFYQDWETDEPYPTDVILQHLRIAHNMDVDKVEDGIYSAAHALRIDETKNLILDHVTLRWGARNNFVNRDNRNITVQYIMNVEPTGRSIGGWHGWIKGRGQRSRPLRPEDGCGYTIYKNLGAHMAGRLNIMEDGRFDYINNLTYNGMDGGNPAYRSRPNYIQTRAGHDIHADANIMGNVLIDGPSGAPEGNVFSFSENTAAYIEGNYRDENVDAPLNLKNVDDDVDPGRGGWDSITKEPLDLMLPAVLRTKADSARRAYIDVLSWGGASTSRDEHDLRIVYDVLNKTGTVRRTLYETSEEDFDTSESQVAAIHPNHSLEGVPGEPFPELDPGDPVVSTASDGIADWWKKENDLDIEKSYHKEYTEDGYTYLEKYLHHLTKNSYPPKPAETNEVQISTADGNGAEQWFSWMNGLRLREERSAIDDVLDSEENGEILRAGMAEDDHQNYMLLRFDLSTIEPGRIRDGLLQLDMIDCTSPIKFRIYGLRHDRAANLWDKESEIELAESTGFETENGKLSLVQDDLVVLGDIETKGNETGYVTLDNPNLPVFLNLLSHYQNDREPELVTLIIKPLEDGEAVFRSGNATLFLDAIEK